MDNSELLKTFDELGLSQDAMAEEIEEIARRDGIFNDDMVKLVAGLREQGALARERAAAIRNGVLGQ